MATKRGCEHDAPVDGSWFDDYVKEFTSAGLSATIRFTGSYLPEDKITCATGDLTLRNRYRTLALSLVPRYCWPSATRTTRPSLRWGHSTRTGEQDRVGLIMSEGMVRGEGRPRSFPKRAPVIQGQSSASYSGSPPSAMLRRMRRCFRARHCMATAQYGYAGHFQVSESVRRHESGSREAGGTGRRIGVGRHSVGRGSPGESHV